MNTEKKDKILYWVFTAPFVLMMLMSSIFYIVSKAEVAEGFAHLGFPAYMVNIIATAKILGVVAIVLDRFKTLKEWAYAGFAINLVGASASHTFSGDDVFKNLMPLVILSLMFCSYFFWKKTSPKMVLN